MHKRLSLKWLEEHYLLYCPPSSLSAYRLLLLDNHTSHQDFDFYHYCWTHKIQLLFFPSYLTHILQPLDQNPFGTIGTYYRQQVEEFFRIHGVYSTIHKGDFFPMVREARRNALTKSNIRAVFRCTGIAPFNRRRVLNNSDLQNPTPLHQTHHNLRPLSTSDSPASQISQLEQELKGATSVEQARELQIQLASLAKTSSAQSALHAKQFQDELKK